MREHFLRNECEGDVCPLLRDGCLPSQLPDSIELVKSKLKQRFHQLLLFLNKNKI